MKAVAINVALFSLVACFALADNNSPKTSEPEAVAPGRNVRPRIVPDIYPRFSLVGDWQMTHPQWTDTATFQSDGTVTTQRQGTAGRWFLAGDGGTPLVIIRWEMFGTESLGMVDLHHFRGQTRNGRFFDMRREASAKTPQ